MGERGPRKKPTRLKVLQGNPGKRPLNEQEPEPAAALPECPEHLSDEARAEWERVSEQLLELGLLTQIDRAALAGYCQAWGRWVEAEKTLKKYGVLIKSPNGHPMQSPALAIANKAMEQMRRFLAEFGMSPASRAGVSADKGKAQDDAWDRLRA